MRGRRRKINPALLVIAASVFTWGRPALADLVIDTNTSSPNLITARFPENAPLGIGVIRIPIGNANVPNLAITTGVVSHSRPFRTLDDITNDVVTDSGDTGDCNNKRLIPSNTPFQVQGAFCNILYGVDVGDADPTDKVNPVVDSGEWTIELEIPWTRADNQAFITHLTLDVTIFDDPVPEPRTVLGTGLACVCIIAFARRRLTNVRR